MLKTLSKLAIRSVFVFAATVANAEESEEVGSHNDGASNLENSFVSSDKKTDYLRRTYGYALWRHWKHVPQELRDNFSKSEANPIWTHHIFLSELEKKLQTAKSPEGQRQIFDTLAVDYFNEATIPSIQHYLPVVQDYLSEVADRIKHEDALMDEYLASLTDTNPEITVKDAPQLSTDTEKADFAARFSDTSQGAGLKWGEYGVAHSLEGNQILATDFLMDCIAVVLTSEDPNNPKDRYAVLAHVDATTDPQKAVLKMLGEIPENHVVKAEILGSDRNENAYMNVSIAEALVKSGRISSIAVNTDAATTVAVHALSGTILSENDPNKGEGNAYQIKSLPVQVQFSESPPFMNFRSMNYSQLLGMKMDQGFESVSPIVRASHPRLPNEVHPALDTLLDNAQKDGRVTQEELEIIKQSIQDNMYAPNGVCISIEESNIVADIGTRTKVVLGYVFDDPTMKQPTYEGVTADKRCRIPTP